MEVTCNFIEDSAELRLAELVQGRVYVPTPLSSLSVHEFYAELTHRLVSPAPRRVFVSREFRHSFEDRVGIDLTLEAALTGSSVADRQSKRLLRWDEHDDLLNDWGIQHFHLGTELEGADPRYVCRTNNLVFAHVTDEAFYAIDVLPHKDKDGRPHWTRKRLVQIMHDNWPDVIRSHRVPPELLPGTDWTDDERVSLRRAHVAMTIAVGDGTRYWMIGGGYATAGNSVRARRILSARLTELRDIEQRARSLAERIATESVARGRPRPKALHLKLVQQLEQGYVVVAPSAPGFELRLRR